MDSVRSSELRPGPDGGQVLPDLSAVRKAPPSARSQGRTPTPLGGAHPPSSRRAVSTQPGKNRRKRPSRLRQALGLALITLAAGASVAFATRQLAEHWFSPQNPSETTLGHQQHWQTDEIVVTLDDSLESLGKENENAIRAAFAEWTSSGAALPTIRFQHGKGRKPSLTPDGVNSILVAPITFEGHELDLAITVGFSSPKTGEITEADIVINSRHRFANLEPSAALASRIQRTSAEDGERPKSCVGHFDGNACAQSYDLQNVLTHEVGHFWGLGEDYEDPRATMFSCTSACEVHKRALADGDRRIISDLYANLESSSWSAQFVANAKSHWLIAPLFGLAMVATFIVARRRRLRAR